MYLSDMVEALGRIGRVGQGLYALDVAIEQAEETEERWSIAELLRIKGELLPSQGAPGAAAEAEEQFRRAPDRGAPARRPVLGITRRHEPRAAAARSRPIR